MTLGTQKILLKIALDDAQAYADDAERLSQRANRSEGLVEAGELRRALRAREMEVAELRRALRLLSA